VKDGKDWVGGVVDGVKNRSGQWEGSGEGGSSTGALCIGYPLVLHIKATVVLSVCVGSAWKIFPITARSSEIIHLNTLNRAF